MPGAPVGAQIGSYSLALASGRRTGLFEDGLLVVQDNRLVELEDAHP
jgi:hypothetical protein